MAPRPGRPSRLGPAIARTARPAGSVLNQLGGPQSKVGGHFPRPIEAKAKPAPKDAPKDAPSLAPPAYSTPVELRPLSQKAAAVGRCTLVGCILPDKHPGLHVFAPTGPRRSRTKPQAPPQAHALAKPLAKPKAPHTAPPDTTKRGDAIEREPMMSSGSPPLALLAKPYAAQPSQPRSQPSSADAEAEDGEVGEVVQEVREL